MPKELQVVAENLCRGPSVTLQHSPVPLPGGHLLPSLLLALLRSPSVSCFTCENPHVRVPGAVVRTQQETGSTKSQRILEHPSPTLGLSSQLFSSIARISSHTSQTSTMLSY